ncbi:MAG: dihydroxy-acid dehydratase [Asticcacaulis sp.]
MAALYLERFMNYGITPKELRSGRPVIGFAQTGSDIAPCKPHPPGPGAADARRHPRTPAASAWNFPATRSSRTARRPTAAIDRNLSMMTLIEILHGYPIDAVVLTTGCDKTTPAGIMAATAVDIPAIVLSGGPMLDGWHNGDLVGSGTVIWRSRRALAAGSDYRGRILRRRVVFGTVGRPLQYHGHGLDYERGRRNARPVANLAARPFRRPIASAARWPMKPAFASSRWPMRTSSPRKS